MQVAAQLLGGASLLSNMLLQRGPRPACNMSRRVCHTLELPQPCQVLITKALCRRHCAVRPVLEFGVERVQLSLQRLQIDACRHGDACWRGRRRQRAVCGWLLKVLCDARRTAVPSCWCKAV